MKGSITLLVTHTVWENQAPVDKPTTSKHYTLNVRKITIDTLNEFNLDDKDACKPYEVRYTVVGDDGQQRLVALNEDVDYTWTVV